MKLTDLDLPGVYTWDDKTLIAADNHRSLRLLGVRIALHMDYGDALHKLRKLGQMQEIYPACVGHMLSHGPLLSMILWQDIGEMGKRTVTIGDLTGTISHCTRGFADGIPTLYTADGESYPMHPDGRMLNARHSDALPSLINWAWTEIAAWYEAHRSECIPSAPALAAYHAAAAADQAEQIRAAQLDRKARELRTAHAAGPEIGICDHGWSPGHALATYSIIQSEEHTVIVDAEEIGDLQWDLAHDGHKAALPAARQLAEAAGVKWARTSCPILIVLRNASGNGCRYDSLYRICSTEGQYNARCGYGHTRLYIHGDR